MAGVDLSTEEVLLRVPKNIALVPLGFAIDAGGSVTKLLYRSKEDYANGIRTAKVDHDDGILRLRHLATEDGEEIVKFLQDHCDILETTKTDSEGWFLTGFKTRLFRKKMEDTMKIKVKTLSEMVAINSGLKGFYGALLPQLRPLSLSQEAVAHALGSTRDFLRMMNSAAEQTGGGGGGGGGDRSFDELKDKIDPVAMGQHVTKLMSVDALTLTRELSDDVIEWPCLNVICGSAAGMIVMKDNGGFEIGSFLPIAGKTFVGFGRLLCGAKDFVELVEMAARGDSRKVDVMASDMKVTDATGEEADWYSSLPDSLVAFSMGKLAENAASESFSKDDLAAGLLNVICCAIARMAVAVARQMKVKCVVFDGSLVNSELVRCTLQKWLLFDSLIQPLIGEQSLRWIFLPYPGFICAFGTWYQNWEMYKGQAEK